MEKFFFDPHHMDRLYNCSGKTQEEWYKLGKPNMPLGLLYMALGCVYEVLYIPFLIVMLSQRFIRFSCFKIMFYLGVIDVLTIVCNSLISGYFTITGSVYCAQPTVTYVSGCFAVGLWCCACMTCMILAINRCVDVLQPPWMGTLFGGYRTYAWLALPTIYGLYFMWFTPPLIYTSVYYADFFDPFVGMEEDHQQLEYTSWPHTINNIVVITVLVSAYTFLCGYVIYRSRLSNSRQISLMQRQMVIQATLICSLILIAATVYVYMQFFSTPAYLVVLGQMTWQGSHGGAVFIYIFLNKSMRRAVAEKFFPATPVNSIADITTTISNRLPKFPTKLRAGVAF
ncbi:Protein SRT-41 [Aphelenchoides avenae]|nr:Protein SRT-41 [Aphelenchus avenae]